MAFEPVTLASLPVDGRKTRRHLTAEQRAEHSRIAAAKWRAKHPGTLLTQLVNKLLPISRLTIYARVTILV